MENNAYTRVLAKLDGIETATVNYMFIRDNPQVVPLLRKLLLERQARKDAFDYPAVLDLVIAAAEFFAKLVKKGLVKMYDDCRISLLLASANTEAADSALTEFAGVEDE